MCMGGLCAPSQAGDVTSPVFSKIHFPSFDPLFSGRILLPELVETVGQTQIKVEHREGTQLIPELLCVSAAVWEFGFIMSGKGVQCVQTARNNDEAVVALR